MRNGGTISSPELRVNTSLQHYSVSKSREAGEQDMRKRCLDSILEEAWVYVKYNNGTEVWYEAGEKETEQNTSLIFTPVQTQLASPDLIDHISLYHFHPHRITGKGFTSETPSTKDIIAAVSAAYFIKAISPELLRKLDFKIVVASGVYTMRLDVNAFDDPTVLNETADTAHSMDSERLLIALGMSRFGYSPSREVHFPALNAEFAREYSAKAVQIEFTPH